MRLISRLSSRLSSLLMLAGLSLALAAPLAAQCVMCRESAKYQRAEALQAINLGIIVLALPPAAIALGIGWVTYRHRNSPRPEPRNQRMPSDL